MRWHHCSPGIVEDWRLEDSQFKLRSILCSHRANPDPCEVTTQSTERICVTSPGSVAVKLSSTSELWSRAETRSRLSRLRITKPLRGKDHEDQREAWRATNQHPSCPRHLLIRWMCRLSREQSVYLTWLFWWSQVTGFEFLVNQLPGLSCRRVVWFLDVCGFKVMMLWLVFKHWKGMKWQMEWAFLIRGFC